MAYARDHYAKSKHDKARKAWRTKKHKARRSFRHAADALTHAATRDGDSDSKISALRQRSIQRWSVSSLREQVAHKLNRRVRSVGAKEWRVASRELISEQLNAAAASKPPDQILLTTSNIAQWPKFKRMFDTRKIVADKKGRLRYSHGAPVGRLIFTGTTKDGKLQYRESARGWFAPGSLKAQNFVWPK